MSYYRAQDYPAVDLLDGEQVTTGWDDEADDVTTRPGKAVCASLADLHAYLSMSGHPVGEGTLIVELDGTPTGERDGLTLYVNPTRLISVQRAYMPA